MAVPAKTHFAPAERASETELLFQIKLIAEVPIIQHLYDVVPVLVAILNSNRQIVFANKAFMDFFKGNNLIPFFGRRPGDAMDCLHANEMDGGCGTSKSCSVCGAVNAILMSQKTGSANLECRITTETGDPLDLLIHTNQYIIGSNEFTIFAASDISDQNRRKALERIFFHDLLNTAGALKGFMDILNDAPEKDRGDYIRFAGKITDHLIEEIMAQKELSQAENHELQINITSFSTIEILKEVEMVYENQHISAGKSIVIDKEADDTVMKSDKILLRRVLGNLVKNGLEAISEGDEVLLDCRKEGNFIEFNVTNKIELSREVKLQIFQRSFSTKGKGRGLGTYSAKLITERYLKGSVHFTSSAKNGTTFHVRLPLIFEE